MAEALTCDNLSKAYRIGVRETENDSLLGSLYDLAKSPIRNFRKLSEPQKHADGDNIFWAVKDVSFEIEKGDVVGIVGNNGAGKSTLLKMLSRITDPTSGSARICGRVSSLLEVGTGFHPDLTGRENVFLNGAILGMSKSEINKKFDSIVEFSGMEKFLDTPTKRYSSGMQVRLAFSVAAHLEPDILIVDEVLAVGDGDFQKKCIERMEGVSDTGQTVLFVSHNMDAISRLCNKCIHMQKGQLVSIGQTASVLEQYLKPDLNKGIQLVCENERNGSGEFRIDQFRLQSKDEGPHGFIKSGSSLCIDVELSIRKPNGLKPAITLHFYDQQNHELFVCDSRYHNVVLKDATKKHRFSFEIKSPFLKPGKYRIDAYIRCQGVVDEVLNAGEFEIGPALPYHYSVPPSILERGVVFSQFDCEVN